MESIYTIKMNIEPPIYKVGFSNDWKTRVNTHLLSVPFTELLKVYSFDDAEAVERKIHKMFKSIHKNEWYSEEVYLKIKNILDTIIKDNNLNDFNRLYQSRIPVKKNDEIKAKDIRHISQEQKDKMYLKLVETGEFEVYDGCLIDLGENSNERNTFRFLYNPDYVLSTKDKRSISMRKLNESRVETTDKTIQFVLDTWSFKTYGKITMKKLADVSGISISSIKRRSDYIKEIIKCKNLGFKKLND